MRVTKVKAVSEQKVVEARDVNLYKKLLNIFGEFCDRYPASSVDGLFDLLVKHGIKVLPKDKRAIDILNYIVCEYDSVSMCVQKITNMRFRDLPTCLKPITKSGNRHEIAFWCKDDSTFGQVKSLLNFDGRGKGYWADVNGDKVSLLDTVIKKND